METCPVCERKLKSANQWHYCDRVNINSLFEGKDDETLLIFDRLLAEIAEWENTGVSATKNCIVFVHKQTFLIIRPMKKMLDLKFYSQQELTELPVSKSVYKSGKFENQIRISSVQEVSQDIFKHLRNSYNFL